MRKIIFSLFFSLLCVVGMAQGVPVSGKVTDAETGDPIAGANVAIKGTAKGTVANARGEFTLDAPTGSQLVISSIGFDSQEVTVSATAITVSLQANNKTLNEVVVVGYGTQKKATLTGSVSTLKGRDLTQRQVATTSNLLQGLAPGVSVFQTSGKPGADAATIRVRGQGSIFSDQGALVLVDGVVSSMDLVDPNAIDNITILKDAASTSIYGSRGANGVILVTTKRGGDKGVRVSYNGFLTQQQATNIPKKVTALEHLELSNEAQRIQTGNPAAFVFPQALIDKYKTGPVDNIEVFDNDWVKLLLTNSGLMQNHNVTVDVGGEKASLFASVSYLDQQGLIPNNSFKRFDLRLNPDIRFNDKLRLSAVLFFNQSTRIEPAGAEPEFIIRQAIGFPATGPAKFGDNQYGDGGQSNRRNPLGQAERSGLLTDNRPSFLGKANLVYTPVKNLDLEVSYAREQGSPYSKVFQTNYDVFVPNVATKTYDFSTRYPGTNSLRESYQINVRSTFLAQGSYRYSTVNHDAKVLVGFQTEEQTNNSLGASRTDFVNEDLPYISLGGANRDNSGGASELALAGAYSRLNYSYRDKYLFEVNGRYDGSSRFSSALGKQWGFFPSASAGWVFSSESFFSGLANTVQFGKVRVSYGALGNQEVNSRYPFAANYISGRDYYFNNTINPGFGIIDAANPDIGWETSTQFDAGLDLTLFRSLNLTVDYYVKTTSDILLRRPIPTYVGLNPAFVNLGSMENRGWEVTLNYRHNFGKFRFDGTALLSDVQNKVLDLPGVPYLDEGLNRSEVGRPLRSYFGYVADGYFQSKEDIAATPKHFFTANPGDIKYKDTNNDGQVNADDRTYLGSNFPRYEYSLNLNLSYGIFDLNTFAQGVGQKENYISGTGAWPFFAGDFVPSLLDMHKDYWRIDNPDARFPRLTPTIGVNSTTSSHWIINSAYLRLKNVNFGVKMPETLTKKLGLQSARVYVSGQNLLTLTKFWEGFDPELNNNNANFYPLMRTYTVGLNLRF
jgi:TonB-linked SusC/RagA family outer membrane protein